MALYRIARPLSSLTLPSPTSTSLVHRRHGSIFTWRRHPAFPSRFLEHSHRKPPPNQRPMKEYLVQTLLLDLDAEGCPAVRPFDRAVDDPQQAAAWDCQPPTRLRWKNMMRESQREAQWAAGRTRLVLDGADPGLRHWGVNEVDLVVFAMRGLEEARVDRSEKETAKAQHGGHGSEAPLEAAVADFPPGGTPHLPTTRPQSRIGQMLHDNGVPHGLGNDAEVLEFLLCVHKMSPSAKNKSLDIQWPRKPGTAGMLEVRRLTALLAQSQAQDGRFQQSLPIALSEAASCLALMMETPGESQASAVLQVVCGLQARWGAEIPTGARIDLAIIGTKAAASTLDARAMAFQLAIGQEAGLWDCRNRSEAGGALYLLGDVSRRITTAFGGFERGGHTLALELAQKRELLHILTGVGKGEHDGGGIYIRNLLYGSYQALRVQGGGGLENSAAFEAYILALAKLGAFRTILYEWHECRASNYDLWAQALLGIISQSHKFARVNDVNERVSLEQAVRLDAAEQAHCPRQQGRSLLHCLV